jgi:release factor glutamine methyltransferase
MTAPAADAMPWLQQAQTRGAARRALAATLARGGLEQPEADARVLLQFALGLDRTTLMRTADAPVGLAERDAIARLAARRLRHEPVAQIVGEKEFWGLALRVTADTLIPRPDTETVVEAALAVVDAGRGRAAALRLADLGTGSGALLLALLSELPQAFGIGTDIGRGALAVARDNAVRLGLDQKAAFLACDFGMALAGGFDLIVANPPYIASGEIATLAPDVRDHEPRAALDGGADGLTAYRALAQQVPALLADGGRLVVEIGHGQAAAVSDLFAAHGLALDSPPRCDLAGTARALILGRG